MVHTLMCFCMLEKIDGHFIRGYGAGESKPEIPIDLIPEATQEARRSQKVMSIR